MGCDKVRLKVKEIVICPLCDEEVEQCDDCLDEPTINEDWYCYSDGDKHYCESCWEEHLRETKSKTGGK